MDDETLNSERLSRTERRRARNPMRNINKPLAIVIDGVCMSDVNGEPCNTEVLSGAMYCIRCGRRVVTKTEVRLRSKETG